MTPRPTTRQLRIEAIQDGALVRRALGQSALHWRLPDGQHQITLGGQQFVGATLEKVITEARKARQ